MEEMRSCRNERLAAETTADKDTGLQRMSAAEIDIKLQQMKALQWERLAAETNTERDTKPHNK